MKSYTYSEARQSLSKLLDLASKEGSVRVRRRDGRTFIIQPEQTQASPLDVDGVDLDVSTEEIVSYVREGRKSYRR